MIRRTSKYLVVTALVGFASYANAGATAVTPAFAACSKALVESFAKTETLPAYTVVARHGKTKELLAKASCKATPAGEIVSFRSIPLKS